MSICYHILEIIARGFPRNFPKIVKVLTNPTNAITIAFFDTRMLFPKGIMLRNLYNMSKTDVNKQAIPLGGEGDFGYFD
ncbi:MAG: hypothetical protein ACI4JY_09250 [Oscillospiraceae bacterium]